MKPPRIRLMTLLLSAVLAALSLALIRERRWSSALETELRHFYNQADAAKARVYVDVFETPHTSVDDNSPPPPPRISLPPG
jgi:hypothetical protein